MEIIAKKKLLKEIVTVQRNVMFTNSLRYSEEFEFNHGDVLKKIRKLTQQYSSVKKWFKEAIFINERNREYPYFEMTRDGYMFLIMQMGGAKSKKTAQLIAEKQQLFIQAFNEMEKALLRQQNTEWVTTREMGKSIRLKETDAIKEFIEYATAQGSKNARMYYKNITSATYKALQLIENSKPKTRELLDVMELHHLIVAENIVSDTIRRCMEEKLQYKDIYVKAREALESFAETINLKHLL